MERKPIRLILASGSPRRKDLLHEAGLAFSIESAQVVELSGIEWTARELCLANAELKAGEVAHRIPDAVVLGADTVVALDDRVFGKPADLDEARAMLSTLCGRVHEVFTGVCLMHRESNRVCRFLEATRVQFRPLEDVDLDDYLSTVHTLDKAGAYAAQEDNGRLITCIEGLMSNVIGLPIERVLDALTEHFPQTLTPKPQD
ncbi:septum formation protein Maf [Spartobacteria bacterium LR76]|nr:septum formation protein Maf [Spartobacteria bacterium LR76]